MCDKASKRVLVEALLCKYTVRCRYKSHGSEMRQNGKEYVMQDSGTVGRKLRLSQRELLIM
jgi:hypothetical protein